MADKTDTELAEAALRELVILDATSSAEAEDDEFVKGISASMHAQYSFMSWPPDSIPERVFLPLAKYLATQIASGYGKKTIRGEPITDAMENRRLNAVKDAIRHKYTGQQVRATYY